MNTDNLFRFAIVMNHGSSKSFYKSIREYAKIIIYDSEKPYLSIKEIVNGIKIDYGLEFTHEEIKCAFEKSINSSSSSIFIQVDNENYGLTVEEIQNIRNKLNSHPTIDNYIESFCKINQIEHSDKVSDLIIRFIYYCFNENRQALSMILNGNKQYNNNLLEFDISDEEKRIINSFLNWDCDEKNEFIYKVVSLCFDYCMITNKIDTKTVKEIFKDKKFYLDANIIIRLMGVDNRDRQNVISNFINKCEECNIKLYYTNVTKHEIEELIKHKIEIIKREPYIIDPKTLIKLKKEEVDGFYIIYYDWCKEENNNNFKDFISFQKYLISMLNEILSSFKFEIIDNQEIINKERFLAYCSSFKDYKTKHNRNPSDEAIKRDINNFLYVLNKHENKKPKRITVFNDYIISTDKHFCNWSYETIPGCIIVVRPSYWLSIILKVKGRTKEDYTTFCKFLNLRYSHKEKLNYNFDKLVESICNLTTDENVIERITIELETMLSEENFDDNFDYDELAEDTYNKVLEDTITDPNLSNNKIHKPEFESETLESMAEMKTNYKIDKYTKIKNKLGINSKLANIFTTVLTLIIFIIIISNSYLTNFFHDLLCGNILTQGGISGIFIFLVNSISIILISSIRLVLYLFFHLKTTEKHKKRMYDKILKNLKKYFVHAN